MKTPITNEGFNKLKQSKLNAEQHTTTITKKYHRIAKEAQKRNDISSYYLASLIVKKLKQGDLNDIQKFNSKLIKTLKNKTIYTLGVYEGTKFLVQNNGLMWSLTNKYNNEVHYMYKGNK